MFYTRRSQLIGISVTIVLFILSMFSSMYSVPKDKLAQLTAQYDTYANKKAMLEAAITKDTTENITKASGLNSDRKQNDDKIASKFFELILTWSSKEEYDAMRKQVMNTYGFKEDSEFMKGYLPPVTEVTDVTGTGKTNAIDAYQASMNYRDMDSYVTKISGDKYSYIAFVTTTGTNSAGSSADGVQMFTYTMNADQQITDIRAYGLTSITQ